MAWSKIFLDLLRIKSLPKKNLHRFKLADDKMNVAQKMITVCYRLESIVVKGEQADNKHFLLFLSMFSTILKARIII